MHQGAELSSGHRTSWLISHSASCCFAWMNQGALDHWKAPSAMPIMPNRMSALSHAVAVSPETLTISWLGERQPSRMAPRKPLQRPHMWQGLALFMVRMGTRGAQFTGFGQAVEWASFLCCVWVLVCWLFWLV